MDEKMKFQILKKNLRKLPKEEVFQLLRGLVEAHLPKKEIQNTINQYIRRGVPFPEANAFRSLSIYMVHYYQALLELSKEYEKEAAVKEFTQNGKPKSN